MLAHQQGLPMLGTIPINTNLRRNSDAGDPTANFTGDDQLASELDALARSRRLASPLSPHANPTATAAATMAISA
jgi:hypothetical protein